MIAKNETSGSLHPDTKALLPDRENVGGKRRPGRPKGSKNRCKKQKKPYPSFPLTLHSTGQYCKKIRGEIKYFGTDADAALQSYRSQCDGLHSGRVAVVEKGGRITLGELVNKFLTDAKERQEAGEIKARTFMDYLRDCERIARFFRKSKIVEDITPDDLCDLRRSLAKGVSAVTLNGRVGAARALFNFAFDEDLISAPLKLKKNLKRPRRDLLRRAKQQSGRQYFQPDEIRRLLAECQKDVTLRAMIFLGINCGLGNTDIACLPKTALDLQDGWLDFARIKTGLERRCPLWPETIEAIRCHLEVAKPGRSEETKGLLFVTRKGQKFVRSILKETSNGVPRLVEHDALLQRFKKVMTAAEIELPGVGFYGLRKSVETFGGQTGEQVAVDHIMGHAPSSRDMGFEYRGFVDEGNLRRVTDHIRKKVLLNGG